VLPQLQENPVKLDAKSVAGLKLGGKSDAIFFDSTLPGFGYRLRLSADGKVKRTWIAQYRRAGGTRRVLIGSADVVSAEAARNAARKILGAAALGQDPQGDRIERREKDTLSFRKVAAEYLAAKQGSVRPRTLVEVTRYLTGGYFRSLHGVAIDKIGRREIAARLVIIKRESGNVAAAAARTAISSLFSWAMQMGYCETNPVIGTVEFTKTNRERCLTDSELAAVWNACDGNDDHARIVRLLILTGCRRAEIGGMRWSEFDSERGTWTLPSERSKNAHAHTLPLPALAWNIINAVPHMAARDNLFGVRADDGFTDWGRAKGFLDAKLGGSVQEWRVHDLRRTLATRMADLGVQPHVVEQILNHQSGHKAGVAGTYNRSSYDREVRAALALWADHIRALVDGGERKVLAFNVS
jgi:integrase